MAKYTPSQILYVPIEVAKYNHKACCINFFGDILRPAFEFPNNSHGIDFFMLKVTGVVHTSKITKMLIGLESTGHYHQNLTIRLRALGHDVAVINPFDSWKERLNKNAKTDKIDLGSIAKALISGKFSSSCTWWGLLQLEKSYSYQTQVHLKANSLSKCDYRPSGLALSWTMG